VVPKGKESMKEEKKRKRVSQEGERGRVMLDQTKRAWGISIFAKKEAPRRGSGKEKGKGKKETANPKEEKAHP